MGKYQTEIPEKMTKIIENCAKGLGGAGVIGGLIGPGADLVAIVPTWVIMTIALAGEAGHTMSNQTAKKLIMAVLTGVGSIMAGTKAASTGIAWLCAPFTFGISLLISAAANAALNASFTYVYGRAVARFFLKTTEITNVEVMVQVVIGIIGVDLGIPTPYNHLA
jgi:hypothetical protein